MVPGLSRLSKQAGNASPATLLNCFKHPLSFAELFDQPVDVLDIGTGTAGNAATPVGIQDIGVSPLIAGHLTDDGFSHLELLFGLVL